MDLGLEGKVSIVTGASRGIGKECALELAKEGEHPRGFARSPANARRRSVFRGVWPAPTYEG